MRHDSLKIREDLFAIWQAGTSAVHGQSLMASWVSTADGVLTIGDEKLPLDEWENIVVVGAGKAAAGMVVGLEESLGPDLLRKKNVQGWVNVPDDCLLPTTHIHLHAARPAAMNEPTREAVLGTEQILKLVSSLGPRDLCIAIFTGGGSALLPAPVPPLRLADKVLVTRVLSAAGADIRQLNTVRKHLSRVKGGGLARHCRAGRLITLMISDVLGDPLEVIASGPTAPDSSSRADAIDILRRFEPDSTTIPAAVWDVLHRRAQDHDDALDRPVSTNLILGNIDVALHAAAHEATRRGYETMIASTDIEEPSAEEVGERLVATSKSLFPGNRPICWINGGEPTVQLVPESIRGKGGRNQQLILAAIVKLLDDDCRRIEQPTSQRKPMLDRVAVISAGTDGEDGPTDAAGAMIWPDLLRSLSHARVDLRDFLHNNDAYHCLGPLGALVRTGPTQTNVCDLRVMIVDDA